MVQLGRSQSRRGQRHPISITARRLAKEHRSRQATAHVGRHSAAGPRSRDLLSRLTHLDISNEAFRFMSIRNMDLGMVPALVARYGVFIVIAIAMLFLPTIKHRLDKNSQLTRRTGGDT